MRRFDQDTSIMRIENTLVELRRPELAPQSKARGILLGVGAWAAIFVVIVEGAIVAQLGSRRITLRQPCVLAAARGRPAASR